MNHRQTQLMSFLSNFHQTLTTLKQNLFFNSDFLQIRSYDHTLVIHMRMYVCIYERLVMKTYNDVSHMTLSAWSENNVTKY